MLRLLAVIALVAACTPPSEPAPSARPSTATPTPFAVTSAAASQTPAASASASTAPSAVPTAIAVEDRADVDGDGKPDKVTLLTAWSESTPRATDSTVRVDLATGKTLSIVLHNTFDPAIALIADADGDKRDEIFVRVALGASTEFWVIVAFAVDRLVTVRTNLSAEDLMLAVGGSVTHGDGFECRVSASGDHELMVRSFEQSNLTDTVYRWQGKTLIRTGSTVTQFREDMRNDPNFSAYYSARCGQPTR